MLRLKDEALARDTCNLKNTYMSQIAAVHQVERAAARVRACEWGLAWDVAGRGCAVGHPWACKRSFGLVGCALGTRAWPRMRPRASQLEVTKMGMELEAYKEPWMYQFGKKVRVCVLQRCVARKCVLQRRVGSGVRGRAHERLDANAVPPTRCRRPRPTRIWQPRWGCRSP